MAMPDPRPQRPSLPQALLPLAVAGLAAALAAQMAARDARYWIPLLALLAWLIVPAILARMRVRRLLMSGDVEQLINSWQGSLGPGPHAYTMTPLVRATAYAAYGWTEAARRALNRVKPGPTWDAALEQRMFVEALLDAFEGDRESAMYKAATLETMPMAAAGPLARRRVHLLRRGLAALTRAFAHTSQWGDSGLLAKAAKASPLVYWAMRYAAAIVAVDGGRVRDVAGLLSDAPQWPAESAFREYHDELLTRAGLAPKTVL
jgi:hypothetical protein